MLGAWHTDRLKKKFSKVEGHVKFFSVGSQPVDLALLISNYVVADARTTCCLFHLLAGLVWAWLSMAALQSTSCTRMEYWKPSAEYIPCCSRGCPVIVVPNDAYSTKNKITGQMGVKDYVCEKSLHSRTLEDYGALQRNNQLLTWHATALQLHAGEQIIHTYVQTLQVAPIVHALNA